MDNPLVVIAAPTHPLASQQVVPLQRLAGETLVVREAGSGTRAAMERHFAAHRLAYRAGCELSTNEALKQAVRAGLGIGFVADYLRRDEPAVLPLLPKLRIPSLPVWLVVHREIQGNARIRAVYDFLARELPPMF